jgi:hypothetical protein
MRITVTPGESGNGIHAGHTTKSDAIHVGSACRRHVSATDSSTSTSRHCHLASKCRRRPDHARPVVAEGRPQLDLIALVPFFDRDDAERPQRIGCQFGLRGQER